MGTVTSIRPTLSLDDEFASFDVREELERQLEQRLREVDLDARPALRPFRPAADEDQLSLIHAPHQTIRLIAPAGSGKTQTIINRVLYLVKRNQAGSHPVPDLRQLRGGRASGESD
jgi:hypothetical protein